MNTNENTKSRLGFNRNPEKQQRRWEVRRESQSQGFFEFGGNWKKQSQRETRERSIKYYEISFGSPFQILFLFLEKTKFTLNLKLLYDTNFPLKEQWAKKIITPIILIIFL